MGPGSPANDCENEELVSEFENACRGGDYEFAPEYRQELIKRLKGMERIEQAWRHGSLDDLDEALVDAFVQIK